VRRELVDNRDYIFDVDTELIEVASEDLVINSAEQQWRDSYLSRIFRVLERLIAEGSGNARLIIAEEVMGELNEALPQALRYDETSSSPNEELVWLVQYRDHLLNHREVLLETLTKDVLREKVHFIISMLRENSEP
jgi:hypothetical protein